MSANELVQVEGKSPAVVASDLLSVIKDIELSIEDSSNQVRPIRLPMVSTQMYVLQKVVIARYSSIRILWR